MKGCPFVVTLVVCLSAFSFAFSQSGSGLQIQTPEEVRGSRLSIRAEIDGGVLDIQASRFLQTTRKMPGSDLEIRTLFPTEFRAVVSGVQEGVFESVPVDYGSGWFMKSKIRAELNQTTEVSLDPAAIELADFGVGTELEGEALARAKIAEQMRRAAVLSPVSVRIIETGEEGVLPKFEVRVNTPSFSEQAGFRVKHEENSKLISAHSSSPLQNGTPGQSKTTTESQPYRVPLAIRIGYDGGGDREVTHSNQLPPSLTFSDVETRFVGTMSGRRVLATGQTKRFSRAKMVPGSQEGFQDAEMSLSWQFSAGEPTDAGILEVAQNAENWMPEFEGTHHFFVSLKDPNKVGSVRFYLDDVSRHPGIAVNAGLALVDPKIRPNIAESVPVEFTEGDTTLKWTRKHLGFPTSEEDSSFDLRFANGEQMIEVEVSSEKVPIEVQVRDWAASGVIRAEILLDGIWEEVAAKGPGKVESGVALAFPLDVNKNGVADAFEAKTQGTDDTDLLTLFEEYRGIYAQGEHRRLDPQRREIFVVDYSRKLSSNQRQALSGRLGNHGLDVLFVRDSEHHREAIGEGAHVVVIENMSQNAMPQVLAIENAPAQVEAWRALRPQSTIRSLFVHGAIDEKMLSEDFLRLLNLSP